MVALMAQNTPSRSLDKVIVRLPDGMRTRLAAEAEANRRTMNAEIVFRLQESFTATQLDADRLAEQIRYLIDRMEALSETLPAQRVSKAQVEEDLANYQRDRQDEERDDPA